VYLGVLAWDEHKRNVTQYKTLTNEEKHRNLSLESRIIIILIYTRRLPSEKYPKEICFIIKFNAFSVSWRD
jgi:hypothetical protein